MIRVSVIIPTLNEAVSLKTTIDAVKALGEDIEIIVVDGGSRDETILVAEDSGALVISSERRRGTQMHAGAIAANGEVLWFLHADTCPSPETIGQIRTTLADTESVGGNFTMLFDGDTRPARFMTWLYPKLRRIGLVYGDSGIFVRREIYEGIGGFKPFPLFEDLDFVRRLRREGRFVNLSASVTTSSRRFERRSFLLMFSRWSFLQILFWLGVSPYFLARFYRPVRDSKK